MGPLLFFHFWTIKLLAVSAICSATWNHLSSVNAHKWTEWGDLHTNKQHFQTLGTVLSLAPERAWWSARQLAATERGDCSSFTHSLSAAPRIADLGWQSWLIKPLNSCHSQHLVFCSSQGHGICNHPLQLSACHRHAPLSVHWRGL